MAEGGWVAVEQWKAAAEDVGTEKLGEGPEGGEEREEEAYGPERAEEVVEAVAEADEDGDEGGGGEEEEEGGKSDRDKVLRGVGGVQKIQRHLLFDPRLRRLLLHRRLTVAETSWWMWLTAKWMAMITVPSPSPSPSPFPLLLSFPLPLRLALFLLRHRRRRRRRELFAASCFFAEREKMEGEEKKPRAF